MSCRNVFSDDGTSEPDATALQAAQACSHLLLFLLCFAVLQTAKGIVSFYHRLLDV